MNLLTKRLIEGARRRLGGPWSERFGVRLELSPREWSLGVRWRTSSPREWPGCGPVSRRRLDVWLHLLPCALHLSFAGPARAVPGTPAKWPAFVPAHPKSVALLLATPAH